MLPIVEHKNNYAFRYIQKQIPDFWIYLKAEYMNTIIFGSTSRNFKLNIEYSKDSQYIIDDVAQFLYDSNLITDTLGLYKVETVNNNNLSPGIINWKEINIDRDPNLYYLISSEQLNSLQIEIISKWCENNIENNVVVSGGLLGFASEIDAAFFKLKWDHENIC